MTENGIGKSISEQNLYDQGSKLCVHYSQTTMQVRTYAQHVLVAYAVGVGLFWSNVARASEDLFLVKRALLGAGFVILVFSVVLGILNQHHSSAFRAVRDGSLVKLEEKCYGPGPWKSHQDIRRRQQVLGINWAWHVPFVALGFVGIISMIIGSTGWGLK